jgi:hypothetical protein
MQFYGTVIVGSAAAAGLQIRNDTADRQLFQIAAAAAFVSGVAGVLALMRLIASQASKLECEETIGNLHTLLIHTDSSLWPIMTNAAPRTHGRYMALYRTLALASSSLLAFAVAGLWSFVNAEATNLELRIVGAIAAVAVLSTFLAVLGRQRIQWRV